MTWEKLAAMSPEEIKSKNLWPAGFFPLPHPHHEAGGMIFPKFLIDETKKQTDRDLTRFDLDFDLPDHFLPEFPAPIYLTTRPDLGDVSQGKLVTLTNFNELFKDILNPKQLEGLRLLVTPFPQQQFNATEDRRSLKAASGRRLLRLSRQRPYERRHPHGRRHSAQRASPSHRHAVAAGREHPAAVRFAAGPQDRGGLHRVRAARRLLRRHPGRRGAKGTNVLERGSQVHFMAEFQALLDFPPAPKLNVFGKLDPAKASESEMRGQEIFFGQGPVRHLPHAALLHRQPHAQLEGGAILQGSHDQRPQGVRGRPDQDLPAARHQGLAALPARRPAADAGGHGRVLQPRLGIEAE